MKKKKEIEFYINNISVNLNRIVLQLDRLNGLIEELIYNNKKDPEK